MRRIIRALAPSGHAPYWSWHHALNRAAHASAESLERRVLLSYVNPPVNGPTFDPGPWRNNTQNETASIAFQPNGGGQPIVVTAYNDMKFGPRSFTKVVGRRFSAA